MHLEIVESSEALWANTDAGRLISSNSREGRNENISRSESIFCTDKIHLYSPYCRKSKDDGRVVGMVVGANESVFGRNRTVFTIVYVPSGIAGGCAITASTLIRGALGPSPAQTP